MIIKINNEKKQLVLAFGFTLKFKILKNIIIDKLIKNLY